jgi:hypothetical protein
VWFLKYLLLTLIVTFFISCYRGENDTGYIEPNKTYGWEKLTLDTNQYGFLEKAVLFNNAIYTAGNCYFKSTDGGVTWYSWFSDSLNCYGLFADSASFFMCTDKGIYRMDKTETVPRLISDKIGFTISASNNNYLYGAGFQSGANSPSGYLSTDRGATWNLIINEVFIWGAYLTDNYLYVSGNVPDKGYSIYRISLNEHRTITDLGKIGSHYGSQCITSGGGKLYAGDWDGIFYLNSIGTWTNIFGKSCFNPFYNFGKNIYTGNTSLYFSRDSGYTWHDRQIPDQSMQIVNVFELGDYTFLQTTYYLWRLPQTSL